MDAWRISKDGRGWGGMQGGVGVKVWVAKITEKSLYKDPKRGLVGWRGEAVGWWEWGQKGRLAWGKKEPRNQTPQCGLPPRQRGGGGGFLGYRESYNLTSCLERPFWTQEKGTGREHSWDRKKISEAAEGTNLAWSGERPRKREGMAHIAGVEFTEQDD